MSIHFSITEPRTTSPYDLTTETVRVRGSYTGAAPDQMWCVASDGVCPSGTHNPFEVNATEFEPAGDGTWEVPGLAIAGDGVKHARVWSIQPGSHTIDYDDREYSVLSSMPQPPMPMTVASVRPKQAGKTSSSRGQKKSPSKTSQSRASQNGSPAKPAAKPVKRRSGKAAKPKAAASRDQGRRGSTTKSKPKAGQGKRSR